MYHHLDSQKIVNTIETLSHRVNERFPNSGLSKVVAELLKTGQKADERCRWVARPLWHLRGPIWILVGLIVISFFPILSKLSLQNNPLTFVEFIQVLESGINDIVFLGIP